MLSHNYPFDTVQLPINILDGGYARSFERMVLPELIKRGIAPLGMKSLSGSGEAVVNGVFTAHEGLRYAMSVPGIGTTISGMESMEILRQNLEVARGFQPLSASERAQLRDRSALYAADGRYELFKTTKKYDGGRGARAASLPHRRRIAALMHAGA